MKNPQLKIQKTSRTLSIFLKIFEIAAAFSAGGAALAMGILLWKRNDMVILFTEAGQFADVQAAVDLLPVLMGAIAVGMGVTTAICELLGRTFRDISRDGTPFAPKHVRRIKVIAGLSLAFSVVGGTVQNLGDAIRFAEPMELVSVSPMVILFAAVIYCLAHIFDYGCQLQQESDETL